MYDIFFIGKNDNDFNKLKSRFITAKRIPLTTDIFDAWKTAVNRSFTDMFWVVWDDLVITDDFNFDYKVLDWDKQYTHVFRNGESFDGVCLFSKQISISKRELDYRFFTNKKEVDIQASTPKKYNIFYINTYEEYLNAVETSTTDMFWCVWPEITITNSSVLDIYFSHHNSYDRKENHVFKHQFNDKEIFTNGLVLFSKEKIISQREFTHRYIIEKKEHDIVASSHKLYDVVFISYNEINADENYNKLCEICPRAKRVHGVKGIHQAHITAAKMVTTPMFWVVDGDAKVVDEFNFNMLLPHHDRDIVHVWKSQNPVNGLVYGNGGVKLLPTGLTLAVDVNSSDMTTSISSKFKAMNEISNMNMFNTDSFATWRSAFRECAKLAGNVIDRQDNTETQYRLNIWCTVANGEYYEYALRGANEGRAFAEQHPDELYKINDFNWLYDRFTKNSVQ